MAEQQRRQRTVTAISDDTLMSVAAWSKTVQPTEEEAAITLDQIMGRTNWEVPDVASEMPAFIGSTDNAGGSWERTERPDDVPAGDAASRAGARAAGAAASGRAWLGSEFALAHLTPEQRAIYDDSKAQLADQGITIPDELIARFVIVKKTSSAVVQSARGFRHWANLFNFETFSWERIEGELNRGLLVVPNRPYSTHSSNGSTCVFMNSKEFEPRSGSRTICASLWLVVTHTLIHAESSSIDGLAIINQGSGISYSKFYPAIQKSILDCIQSVLPVRVSGIYMVDPPYIFQMLWGVVSAWLSEKMRNRMFVLSSSNVHKHFNPEGVPTFLKGQHSRSHDDHAAWIADLKAFYHEEFAPMMNAIADNPGSVRPPELWEPAHKKK